MERYGRKTLPELIICAGCGVLFRVIEKDDPGCIDAQCPCGNVLVSDASRSYEIEAVECALAYEWN